MTPSTTPDPIQTKFGFHSTAAEVIEGIDLSGKQAIVTGGASGIGVETARALAGAGAGVTLAVRDTDAGTRTAAEITAATGNTAVSVGMLDLSDPRRSPDSSQAGQGRSTFSSTTPASWPCQISS
jgi:pyruvate/2-oxoglutarate dehydrogenase complex dihydrolipoamide dehydrogenase (E3) component